MVREKVTKDIGLLYSQRVFSDRKNSKLRKKTISESIFNLRRLHGSLHLLKSRN